MKKLLLAGALIGGAAPLASCVLQREEASPLIMNAQRDGEGCRITVNGERVTSEQLVELSRSTSRRLGIVLYDRDTPYKCIGGAIYSLQRAGLRHVYAAQWGGS
ncbi:ExbD/TolR family protein [Sphingomonas bacterium]|uniref:ExbD/TolR family protein n=1 Tax=Sphingomonas bacterium TaxID=1895847 RepID=UPI001574F8C3|nr:hypothetical protein [Sphingomonas bacterium]